MRSEMHVFLLIAFSMMFTSHCAGAAQSHRQSVDQAEHVLVAGRKLYVRIRSADRNLPILLWVHGGPGGAERPLFRYYNSELENSFVVAYWDQRGAGRSFDTDEDPHDLTIARHLTDLDAIINHLRNTLRPDKILLLGHSWGAALAILYADAHPSKVSAVFAVNPLVDVRKQRQAEYQFVRAEAARRADAKILEKAEELGAPPYEEADQALKLEKLDAKYGGVFHKRPNRIWIMLRAFAGGLIWPWEVPKYIHANEVSLQAMNDELNRLDLTRSTPSLDVPAVFFLGRFDRHADARVASAYFKKLQAPVKLLVWFENAAHNIPFEEPERFDAAVVQEFESAVRAQGRSERGLEL